MKKVVVFILAIMFFIACDKVKQPNQNPGAISNCTLSAPVVKTNTATSGFRKILVEDYTGHRCGNCPRAAEKLEALELQYKDSVVGMAVHAGTQFAPPKLPEYPDDFRTDAGTDWDTYFGPSAAGLPKGMINRTQPYVQAWQSWDGLVKTNLHKPQTVKMDITTYFDVSALLLNVDVKATFKSAFANDIKLVLAITEDSIPGHQTDYNPPSWAIVIGDEVTNYVFNNLLRGSVNSSWGELLKAKPIAVNDTITKKTTCCKVTCANTKNVNLVAFVYDDVTKEVLQAEKIKLK